MNRFHRLLGLVAACLLSIFWAWPSLAETPAADADLRSRALALADAQLSPQAELIYRILVAETAGKRGQFEAALEHYRIATRLSDDPRVAERAVRIALYLNDSDAFLAIAERWHELDPTEIKARQVLVLALMRAERIDAAAPHLDAVREASADDGEDGFATLNALFEQIQNPQAAFQAMQALLERQPESRFARYYYAQTALAAAEYEPALAALSELLEQQPEWGQAHLLQARVLLARGDTETALAGLAEAVATLQDDPTLRTGYARFLANAGELEQAREQFQQLAASDPQNPEPRYALGLLAAEAGQYDTAVTHFMETLALNDQATEVYFELGKIEQLRGNYSKAREWYGRVRGQELFLQAQARIGAVMADQGDFDDMSAHFDKLRQHFADNAPALYISEAEVLRQNKRYAEAFELLDQALEQLPDNEDLLYARALAAEKTDQLDILERDLKRLIASDPENGHALNALGYTLADRTDRHQEALGYLERAIALLPDDAAVLDSMGWVHYRLGNYAKALEYLQRAYERDDDPEIASHLSEVLWKMGRHEEAMEIWQRAIDKAPDSEHLLEVKDLLAL